VLLSPWPFWPCSVSLLWLLLIPLTHSCIFVGVTCLLWALTYSFSYAGLKLFSAIINLFTFHFFLFQALFSALFKHLFYFSGTILSVLLILSFLTALLVGCSFSPNLTSGVFFAL
jgi:hypothetical protein